MKVRVNGESRELPEGRNVQEALRDLQVTEHVAVALNMTCVTHSQRAQTILHEGDELEILSPMQGG